MLFVVSGLRLGGAERQVVLCSREMVKRGHQVCVYALNRELQRADEVAASGAELVVDPKRWRLDPSVVLRLRRHVRRWRADVVHGMLYDGNLYSRLAGAGQGVAVINSERNDNYHTTALQRAGYRLTSSLCDSLIANTHAGARFARSQHQLSADRVHVVWNGIDLVEVEARIAADANVAQRLCPGSDIKRLCVVGALRPAKDHHLALRTVACLVAADPTWQVLILGDETSETAGLKAELVALRDRLGLKSHVSFVGNRRDVLEVMAGCQALLMTSRHEGFPNVVLEAMACRTPVASTDYSDVRRILPLPWQVSADRSPETLAAIVARCVEEHAEVAQAQRAWVEDHATIGACTTALLVAYSGQLGPRTDWVGRTT